MDPAFYSGMHSSHLLSERRALPVVRDGRREREPEIPDLQRSVERVVDRARDVLVDQVQLWRLEAIESAQQASRGAAGLLAGAAFGALAWVLAMMALQELLLAWMAPPWSLLLVALLNAAIAAAALRIGRRGLLRTRGDAEGEPRS